ncbi:MAG: glycerophosphodiester phosphodiesterase family protein [Pseudomonadota bacterium]
MSEPNTATELRYGDRTVRLKWHKLRREAADPPFLRSNLRAGLAAGASLEVDLRRLACGRFVCLHDADLAGETTGEGRVEEVDADAVRRLDMLGSGEPPLLLDELADAVRSWPRAPSARIQLDLKSNAAEVDQATRGRLASALEGVAGHFILSGCDWDAVSRLGDGVPGLALGYDPMDDAGHDAHDVTQQISNRAPHADTIYLHRGTVRAAEDRGEPLVAKLRARGQLVDCWTIDHGTAAALEDIRIALAAGCDQITTNTPAAWAAAKL